jgi:hypothetical protein
MKKWTPRPNPWCPREVLAASGVEQEEAEGPVITPRSGGTLNPAAELSRP